MKKKKSLKKVLLALAVFIILALVFLIHPFYAETVPAELSVTQHLKSAPKLIAHRGFSGVYPENTIPAFEGAAEAGFWGAECDLHTTQDGKWVVIHDDEISYHTDGEGEIEELTFNELMEFRIDNGNGIENYSTLPIPTLEEYLKVCVDRNIVPVIEFKKCDPQYFPSLIEAIDEYGLSEKAVFISFEAEYLTEYRKLDKDATILYLRHTPTKEDIDFCIENDFGINFLFANLYKCAPAINYAKKSNLTIATWTVDHTICADVMALFGVEYITTNKIKP